MDSNVQKMFRPTSFPNIFEPREELDGQPMQAPDPLKDPNWWCHRKCESDYPHWTSALDKSLCKVKCNKQYQAPEKSQSSEHPSQGSTDIDVSNILQDIGDNFHTLADSFSVL